MSRPVRPASSRHAEIVRYDGRAFARHALPRRRPRSRTSRSRSGSHEARGLRDVSFPCAAARSSAWPDSSAPEAARWRAPLRDRPLRRRRGPRRWCGVPAALAARSPAARARVPPRGPTRPRARPDDVDRDQHVDGGPPQLTPRGSCGHGSSVASRAGSSTSCASRPRPPPRRYTPLRRQPAEGRALQVARCGAAVLILDEPTRGVDVGAKADVHRTISHLAAQGLAIVLISSELPEVLGMSDRILVLREAASQPNSMRPKQHRSGSWTRRREPRRRHEPSCFTGLAPHARRDRVPAPGARHRARSSRGRCLLHAALGRVPHVEQLEDIALNVATVVVVAVGQTMVVLDAEHRSFA